MAVFSALSIFIASFVFFAPFSDVSGIVHKEGIKTKKMVMFQICVGGHTSECIAIGIDKARDVCATGENSGPNKDWDRGLNLGTANYTGVSGNRCVGETCNVQVKMNGAPGSEAVLDCRTSDSTKPGYKLGDTDCTCNIFVNI
uniref:Secreted protein n=1 Tax=Cacopsylla melanoneura TaxID=428564 RepID=A0A8D8YHR4_9HEMI